MRYQHIWDKVLGAGEHVAYEFSISHRYINISLGFWFFVSLAFVPFYGIGIVLFAAALFHLGFYLRVSNAYAFTNKRILIKRGWLSTNMVSIDFSRITDIKASESFFDRVIFRSGILLINTAGTGEHEVRLNRVYDVYSVKQRLTTLMDQDEHAHSGRSAT